MFNRVKNQALYAMAIISSSLMGMTLLGYILRTAAGTDVAFSGLNLFLKLVIGFILFIPSVVVAIITFIASLFLSTPFF